MCSIQAATLTTTNVQGVGTDWNGAIWRTNGTGSAVGPPISGNTYACVANGVPLGMAAANTRIRNPTTSGLVTFPGDSLTLNTNTELRMKHAGTVLNFPGANGNAGLVLNGGLVNVGDETVFTITGRVQVISQSYLCPGEDDTGTSRPQRGINLAAQLSGNAPLVIMQASNVVPQTVSGTGNSFSGQWIIKAGWLLAGTQDCLGTNTILVDPGYVPPIDPGIASIAGPAIFEPSYDVNSAGQLLLTNGGVMNLHQDCIFSGVTIEGTALAKGIHSYSELEAAFPASFIPGGSGSLTVQPYGPPPPAPPRIVQQPEPVIVNAGGSTQLVAFAQGGAPLGYQWQTGTLGVFSNCNDSAVLSGSRTNLLTFTGITTAQNGDYRLIVTNSLGAVTSQVATVTVLIPDSSRPRVVSLSPAAGASVASLTQIQVLFSKEVLGVQASDLQVNGAPASFVSGSGAGYLFTFSQPAAGLVSVYWDTENSITDTSGNPLETGASWNYTLADSEPPALAWTAPAPGATVASFRQVEVAFSEPVSGVAASDLLVNGSPATNVTGAGIGPYTFYFLPQSPGSLNFSWNSNLQIRDAASNLLSASGWTSSFAPAGGAAALTNVVINEFLAANNDPAGLLDEDLEPEDWLELYNKGNTSINLTGWSLTDDPGEIRKWTFPATNIGPGSYLVLFASGKDRRVAGARLHTDFKLSTGGGYLGLYDSGSPPQAVFEYAPYPEQRTDISYGLDSGADASYFPIPTPGGPNGSGTLTGLVSQVHLSVNSGFFNQAFQLSLTCRTPGALILYTTNGSEPLLSGTTTNGWYYINPLSIARTTVIRAAAFAPNLLPSTVSSRSYFFVEDIVHQPNNPDGYPTGNVWTPTPGTIQNGSRAYYQMDPFIVNDPQYSNSVRAGLLSIPTLSIQSSIDGLFGPVNGIYTHPQSRGAGWERTCSMELVFPDGSPGLQLDCGVQIQGGTQRDPGKNAKHSFRVNFKGEYGASELRYPLFSDSPIRSFNTLVLDGGINYWWHYVGGSAPVDQRYRAQCVRDQFTSDLMLAIGQPSWRGQFYHLYLNGLYWGLHYIHERPDDAFAADYLGGARSDYDVLRVTTVGLEVVAGDATAWNAALALSNSGLTNNAQYLQLQQYVDVDNLIDYMIVNHWVGNTDWPHHNWYVIRKRAAGEGFKFIIWDAEHVLKSATEDRTTATDAGSPAQIYGALINNPEFRLRYADHVQKHFSPGGIFYTDPNPARALWDPAHPERNRPASFYMKRINEIDSAIVDESARWGGYLLTTNYTRNIHWLRELNNLLGFTNNPGNTANFFPTRSATVLSQYRALGLWPSVTAPVLSQSGGIVPTGFALSITNLNSGGRIYYTTNGTDPRSFASGAISPGALEYTGNAIVLAGGMVVKARVLNGSWSPLTEATFSVALVGSPIRFTELMYHPVGGDAFEFIELQNIGATPVDLSGYSFEGITYVFPNGTILPPGGVIVLSSDVNPSAFAARYPGVVVTGAYGGALANSGERIALLDAAGNTVISVDYRNNGGWPTAADGGGYSLEIIDPNGDPDDPANWRASTAVNGSPGLENSAPGPLPAVRLNELMAENDGFVSNGGTYPDWVELYNDGASAAQLDNWSLSDSGNARKFVFPSGTAIPANGFLVLWCDSATNAPGLHTGFALARSGESVFLYDASTNRVDAFTFGLQLTNFSVGRVGAGAEWQLTVPTPGSNNVAAPTASAGSLAINEWLANSSPGTPDWLELFNRSSQPIPLRGLYLGTSKARFQIRSYSFISPHGFVQFFADENPGPDHVDFKLPASGDALSLMDAAGQMIDQVSFGAQVENVSEGRLPDGGAVIWEFPGTLSPGASNYVLSYTGPVLNEIMARNSAAVYDRNGNTPDWIELFNPNAAPWDLSAMRIGLAPDAAHSWTIPPGTTIAANGYLQIWCDSSQPASTNSGAYLNSGFDLNGEGASVFLFNTNAQVVDSVSFGFQVTDQSIGRANGAWRLLGTPTPGGPNSSPALLSGAAGLRINEWMADPLSGNDWFEVYNSNALPVGLEGLYVTDDPSITGVTNSSFAPLSFIAPRGFVKLIADGQPGDGSSHVRFSLNRDGETLRVYDSNLQIVDSIDFALQWPGISEGRLPDGAASVVDFPDSPTPDSSNYLPLTNVVVNEVLSHTDPPLEDAIELYNPSSSDVPIGGWFMSNAESDFRKYRIPGGTILPAHGYRVFYEYEFNSTNASPFTLNSAHGDSVKVSQADGGGNLTGYRAQLSFGAAENGVSWGRFQTSVGVDFVPLAARTFGTDNPSSLDDFRTGLGLTNAPPKVGPVVISEIMYHPVTWIGTNASENPAEEFIELANLTPNPVPLFDPAVPANRWRLGGGIQYEFPGGTTVAPLGTALIVSFDPTADQASLANFRAKYSLDTNASIFGPFSGRLNNAGDTVVLSKPDSPQDPPHPDAGYVPYVQVEQITYSNAWPWSAGANGSGASLQRIVAANYGNEPLNWTACGPTPGQANCGLDSDGDGLPDAWEIAHGLDPYSATGDDGAAGDPDQDGFSNLQEFIAGTDPRDPGSRLQIDAITSAPEGTSLSFAAVGGRSYTIQYRDSLAAGTWRKLSDFGPLSSNGTGVVTDTSVTNSGARFYRLTTPALP